MARMATRFSDADIATLNRAATLNRMGVRTGQRKTWTAHRVGSIRKVHGMHAYRSAEKDGAWLTMREAAAKLGVTSHTVRRLIGDGELPAEQVVTGAPWQIRAENSEPSASQRPSPANAVRVTNPRPTNFQCSQTLDEKVHNDSALASVRMAFSMALNRSRRGRR